MQPKEVKAALDLLEASRTGKKISKDEEVDTSVIPEGFEDCAVYNIEVMCWFGNQPYQFKVKALLNDAEAMAARKTLDTKMYELGRGTASSFSITLRGMSGQPVSRAFTNVVYMEHDIPQFKEVAEDESVDE